MLQTSLSVGQYLHSGNRTCHVHANSRFRSDKSRPDKSRLGVGHVTRDIWITHASYYNSYYKTFYLNFTYVYMSVMCVCVWGGLSEVIVMPLCPSNTIMNTCAHPPINHGRESLIHEQ